MGFLVACKNEEDPIKNEGARVVTTLFIDFSDTQGQIDGILPKFKLKNEEDPIKIESTRVVTTFLPL